MGDQTLSMPLQKMIAGHADITPIREKLMSRESKIADVVADFWKEWKTNN
jgi:hypothetical protein